MDWVNLASSQDESDANWRGPSSWLYGVPILFLQLLCAQYILLCKELLRVNGVPYKYK